MLPLHHQLQGRELTMGVEYIETESDGATYIEVRTGANSFETFGHYYPKHGACPRCRATTKHTVGAVHRCTKCLNYWAESK